MNSKLAGEYFVRNIMEEHYIIGSSSLFGVAGASGKGGDLVETMIKKAQSKEEIKVVDDMTMSPTYIRDAADMIKKILAKKLPFGTYHVSNSGRCSWYEFVGAIFDMAGIEASLSPARTEIIKSKARRPVFSPIVSIKLKKYGLEMESWKSALKKLSYRERVPEVNTKSAFFIL